jgi:predicted ArsR family transcriptional regulator
VTAPGEHRGALEILKALGDNTRYAIYLELARSAVPLSTADIADGLGLHPNTVRPHLERMRDVGLLDVEAEARGGVGRPQHLYSLSPDAPSLGLEPPAFPMLARMLAEVAALAGADGPEAVEIGRAQGRAAAAGRGARRGADVGDAPACVAALVAELARLGFDPAVAADGTGTTVAFTHCPFGELAEAHPELVCHLHKGMVEGFVGTLGGATVEAFGTLLDRDPCRVELSHR